MKETELYKIVGALFPPRFNMPLVKSQDTHKRYFAPNTQGFLYLNQRRIKRQK